MFLYDLPISNHCEYKIMQVRNSSVFYFLLDENSARPMLKLYLWFFEVRLFCCFARFFSWCVAVGWTHCVHYSEIHKCRHLTDFHFIPIGPRAVQFLEDLGNKVSNINGERHSKSFLFQSIGIAIQRAMLRVSWELQDQWEDSRNWITHNQY